MSSVIWDRMKALEAWGIPDWGGGIFDINEAGNLAVTVDGKALDLKSLVDEVRHRGIEPPILFRLFDLLDCRTRRINACFARAIEEYGYSGSYRSVFPIKVNQQRHVIERLLQAGRPYHLGLEVGSKPELLAAVAHCDDPEALIICNGFKDTKYIESALLAQHLHNNVVVVLDRPEELAMMLEASQRLSIKMKLGMRAKLAAHGSGHWHDSSGHRAKFGLTVPDMLDAVRRLDSAGQLDALVLLHFHIGSQINDIVAVKRALREAARLYVALRQRGAALEYLDVGGGLGVDYTGTRSRSSASSLNYDTQEYANDVVYWVGGT